MKILALSDKVVEIVYSTKIRERFNDVELIVGCGDLPPDYLEFVISMLDVPLLYVPGNHDLDDYEIPGGLSIDGKVIQISGINAIGLGGSRRYKPRGKHQYDESEMRLRVWRMLSKAYAHRLFRGASIDLMISHSPPLGIHDSDDITHRGFASFHTLLNLVKPKILLHGHSHVHRNIERTETVVEHTRIINVYPYRIVELERPK